MDIAEFEELQKAAGREDHANHLIAKLGGAALGAAILASILKDNGDISEKSMNDVKEWSESMGGLIKKLADPETMDQTIEDIQESVKK